jgi:hypothetical protein
MATRVATLALPPASLESGRRLLHDLAAFGDADDANKLVAAQSFKESFSAQRPKNIICYCDLAD